MRASGCWGRGARARRGAGRACALTRPRREGEEQLRSLSRAGPRGCVPNLTLSPSAELAGRATRRAGCCLYLLGNTVSLRESREARRHTYTRSHTRSPIHIRTHKLTRSFFTTASPNRQRDATAVSLNLGIGHRGAKYDHCVSTRARCLRCRLGYVTPQTAHPLSSLPVRSWFFKPVGEGGSLLVNQWGRDKS